MLTINDCLPGYWVELKTVKTDYSWTAVGLQNYQHGQELHTGYSLVKTNIWAFKILYTNFTQNYLCIDVPPYQNVYWKKLPFNAWILNNRMNIVDIKYVINVIKYEPCNVCGYFCNQTCKENLVVKNGS